MVPFHPLYKHPLPLICGIDKGAGTNLVYTSVIPFERRNRICYNPIFSSDRHLTAMVRVIGKTALFTQLGDLDICICSCVAENPAMPLLIRTFNIDKLVKENFPIGRRSSLSGLTQSYQFYNTSHGLVCHLCYRTTGTLGLI